MRVTFAYYLQIQSHMCMYISHMKIHEHTCTDKTYANKHILTYINKHTCTYPCGTCKDTYILAHMCPHCMVPTWPGLWGDDWKELACLDAACVW